MIEDIRKIISLMNTYNVKKVSQMYGMSNGFAIDIKKEGVVFSTYGNTGFGIVLSEEEFTTRISSAYISTFYEEIAQKVLSRHITNKTKKVSNKIYSLSLKITKDGFDESLLKEGLKELQDD